MSFGKFASLGLLLLACGQGSTPAVATGLPTYVVAGPEVSKPIVTAAVDRLCDRLDWCMTVEDSTDLAYYWSDPGALVVMYEPEMHPLGEDTWLSGAGSSDCNYIVDYAEPTYPTPDRNLQVMVHEFLHVAGVDHIEGHPLMNDLVRPMNWEIDAPVVEAFEDSVKDHYCPIKAQPFDPDVLSAWDGDDHSTPESEQ